MRTIIDQNERFAVAKVSNNGSVIEYQVCDKEVHAGHKGFVIDRTRQLAKAREIAGIRHTGNGSETKPKSAYPEQQTGYKKQPKGRKVRGKL